MVEHTQYFKERNMSLETDVTDRVINYLSANKVHKLQNEINHIYELLTFLALNGDNCIVHVKDLVGAVKSELDNIPISLSDLIYKTPPNKAGAAISAKNE